MTDYLISIGLSEDISILIQIIVYVVGGIVVFFKLFEYFIKIFRFFRPKKISIQDGGTIT